MKVHEAKQLYESVPDRGSIGFRDGEVYDIEMLGWLSRCYIGNRKVIDSCCTGHNTKFSGKFRYSASKGYIHLSYNLPENSVRVRVISDRVRYVGGLYIGQFHVFGIRLGWFTMLRDDW